MPLFIGFILAITADECLKDWHLHGKSCYLFGKQHKSWSHAMVSYDPLKFKSWPDIVTIWSNQIIITSLSILSMTYRLMLWYDMIKRKRLHSL